MYTIVGSGFGLYGYLPAVLESNSDNIILPIKYRENILKRPELNDYCTRVKWCSSIDQCFNDATGVIIAIEPQDQPDMVRRVMSYSNVRRIILEKPLGVNPTTAKDLLDYLISSRVGFRINYSFPYCTWEKHLNEIDLRDKTNKFDLSWTFFAHHFSNNLQTWKRHHTQGGGVVRFYGIHLISLLAKLGYTNVEQVHIEGATEQEPERLSAIFSSTELADFRIFLNSATERHQFRIDQVSFGETRNILDLKSPFDLEQSFANQDARSVVLHRLLTSLNMSNNSFYNWYMATNQLWSKVEAELPSNI